MIERLHIVNFQSHEDSQLEFAPGVNVIVGDSDSGKTAIIRALRWLIHNRPGGDSFRSNWGGDTRVIITTTEQDEIERAKIKSGNIYRMNDDDFKAFGSDVPEPIQKVLNMDAANLQQQLDSPFLISSSAGEVAAFFNRVANLEQIDSGLRNVQAEIRTITNKIQADELRVGELEIAVQEYDYIEWAEIELEVLEMDQERMVQKAQSKNRLGKLIQDLEEVEDDIEECSRIQVFDIAVHSLLAQYAWVKEKRLEAMQLFKLINDITQLNEDLEELEETTKHEKDVKDLLKQWKKRNQIQEENKLLSNIIDELSLLDFNIQDSQIDINKLQKRFDSEMPDICPLCDTKLN